MTEHTSSYYAARQSIRTVPALSESVSCDVCVVGGGLPDSPPPCIYQGDGFTTWCYGIARMASELAGATVVSW